MAILFTPDQSGDSALAVALASGWWLVGGTLTFSGSYAAGGDTINLGKLLASGGSLRRVIPLNDVRGLSVEYIKSTQKLMIFQVVAGQVAQTEHTAAAYAAFLTASPIDMAFLVKFG